MKKEFKIYLEPESYEKLKRKALEMGFNGKGSVSHYIEKISNEPVVFMDSNVRTILELLKLKTGRL